MAADAGGRLMRLGFAFNPTSEKAVSLRARALAWCEARGVEAWATEAGDRGAADPQLPGTDALVVLGGDGTFLRAAQGAYAHDIPILGINSGKVGFLSKAESANMEAVLEGVVAANGASSADDARRAPAPRGREEDAVRYTAPTRAAVVRGSRRAWCGLEVDVDASHVATWTADGLVVSCPRARPAIPSAPAGRSSTPPRATSW